MGNHRTILFDRDKLIPAFTVEMKLMKLPPSQYRRVIAYPEGYFGCSRTTLLRLRYMSYEDHQKSGWSPKTTLLQKVADYFNCTIDSLINKTKEKLIQGEQLEALPTKSGKQLDLTEATHKVA